MSSGINWLLNPSKSEIEALAVAERTNDFRAIIDVKDNLYVWPTSETTHHGFQNQFDVEAKACIYIYPREAEVHLSTWSHGYADSNSIGQKLKEHPKLKFFKVGA